MPCDEFSPDGARWRDHSLVDANRQIARFFQRHRPLPRSWAREPTRVALRCASHARPPARLQADERGARSASRAVTPSAHGGILALSNSHVQVAHGAFEDPVHLLHLEAWTISAHTGGWAHSENRGATWSTGLGPAANSVAERTTDDHHAQE